MSKYIFKVEDVEIDRPKIFDVSKVSEVIVNHFHFMENQISRIEVEKIKEYPDTIFINLYSGNMKIGDVVAKDPYVLDISNIGNVQIYYDIRPATKLDREE